ncbi:MAG TPA: hypothetical protein VFT67_04045 [Jatrophihabitantaceae bacterium]|nr:hypothetical protein [Jatrophihabitantaceae bacterium]
MRLARRHGLRWLAASAGIAVAGATVLAMAPAHADSATVSAQLSLSGVATKDNVLGGTTIGVHPGDTVDFKASALPTAGLENIPALGSLLDGVLSNLLGSQFQVVVTFGSDFGSASPALGGQSVTLGGPTSGSCKGDPDEAITFPKAGSYSFTWTVRYVLPGLLGCTKSSLGATSMNQLQQAGIAINASNQWVGQVVVANDPPKGGISVQLPGVGAAPSLPVVGQLPGATLPPVSLPTIPVGGISIPGIGGGSASSGSGSGTTSTGHAAGSTKGAGSHFTPPGLTVPEEVVPKGYGNGNSTTSGGTGGAGSGLGVGGLSDLGVLGDIVAGDPGTHTAAPAAATAEPSAAPGPTIAAHAVLSATSTSKGQQMPVLLAIVSIIALSLVTAIYARMYLLRKK